MEIIPRTLSRIKRYKDHLDIHKVMVLHFKIAWIYLCGNKPEKAIKYLIGIIDLNRKSLREDIQSYSRLMHLMALHNLSEYGELMKALRRYKYYFEKVSEINSLQNAVLKYFYEVSNAPLFDRKEITNDFLLTMKELQKDRFEKNAFIYLDVIYWLKNCG